MCAYRDFGKERPHVIASKYRLNQTQSKAKHVVLERKRKECEVPEIHIEPAESNSNLHSSWRTLSVSSDDDLDPYNDDEEEVYSRSSQDEMVSVYETACKRHKLLPLTCIKRGLLKQILSCRYVNLQKDDCLCLCYALCNNRFVEQLDLRQNGMGPEPARFFAEVIENSSFLTHITISDNDLKSAGIRPICEAVMKNRNITYLDLSGNGLVESDGECFEKLIENSRSLTELYLGHNKLMDQGVGRICEALKKNDSLEVLDLSWNHIRLKGAEAIGEAIEMNNTLLKVNLEWNGLHQDGAFSIARALKKNETLIELNLVCNRLSEYCIAEILKGLQENSSLEILRIGQNQVTTRGALLILKNIKENTSSKISVLDFGNQEVHDSFEQLYLEMKKERDITVVYGSVWKTERAPLSQSAADDDEIALLSCNPLTVLMECMRLQNMRLIDFFKSLDKNKSDMICINELCEGLLRVGVQVKQHVLLQLLTRLDKDKNGQIDFGEMINAQNMHRNNLRKIFASPSNVEFENTEIGKVSILLRKVMNKNFIMKSTKNDVRQKSAKGNRTGSRSNTPSPFQMDKVDTIIDKQNERKPSDRKSAKSSRETLRVSSASSDSSRDSSKSSISR
ncbi:leucine-rich repeat-containing protein 74A-like [Ruditapes philippinarum]|uniref:leucine-rich repeat-containing protein 74A-like n=1 Tax=Ruditapes philippinarum TaxID=129788 RepID=UPI00295A9636|nr:leucine-rich repeat-containing protein 74A-like [Ruditapes philippinarum]